MSQFAHPQLRANATYQPVLRELGIDAETIFTHPQIVPWRILEDRENCTLDATLRDGTKIRWHVKHYHPVRGIGSPAEQEMLGHQLLVGEDVPTAPLVAWGGLPDGRSFTVFEDLRDFSPADKLIERGTRFERLLRPTADLAARLHRLGLHHRDLYLCHFMAKVEGESAEIRLIDTARVRRLPGVLTRRRWIVKDLAQFWYSALRLPITDEQRTAWLARYAEQRGLASPASLRPAVERKAKQISRHDARLNHRQPSRNVSIPEKARFTKGG